MFPALVRYDEAERGMMEHACRLVVAKSRYTNYIYPATHYAASSANTSTNLPSMGQRLRLKAGFVIPANWTKEEKAVLLGLKKYGAMVADNGSVFLHFGDAGRPLAGELFRPFHEHQHHEFRGHPDDRAERRTALAGRAGGQRRAGPDRAVRDGRCLCTGVAVFSNSTPAIQWKKYSGPGTVTFGNAALTNTTATFSAPGVYTLELSADDGVHAVAYDAVVITVSNAITVSITRAGTNVNLSWTGGTAPFVVQKTDALPAGSWSDVVTTNVPNASVPVTNATAFFRVKGQ